MHQTRLRLLKGSHRDGTFPALTDPPKTNSTHEGGHTTNMTIFDVGPDRRRPDVGSGHLPQDGLILDLAPDQLDAIYSDADTDNAGGAP